jgi:hypothetical protein
VIGLCSDAGVMRRSPPVAALFATAACLALAPGPVLAQPVGVGLTPLALDLKKVPVGTWAEYTVNLGPDASMAMKSRWALVARDANGSTLETSVEGGPMAMVGGRMVMRLSLVPDPVASEKPIKQTVVQVGNKDPMELPLTMPNMPPQKFQKPDPKKIVGKEQLKVPGGTFKTSHYHDVTARGIVDIWVNDGVGPLGVVKMTAVPEKPDPSSPPIVMVLSARGKDAKSFITKTPKPFDPAQLGPPPPPPGAGPPPGAAPPPGAVEPAPRKPPAKP